MAQALNRDTDKEPSVTHTDNKDNFDDILVYKDGNTLEHWPGNTEYMVPSKENTKFWQSTLESDKSELNLTLMIPTQFFSEIIHDKYFDESKYISTRDYIRLWVNRNVIYHEATRNAINIMMPLTE